MIDLQIYTQWSEALPRCWEDMDCPCERCTCDVCAYLFAFYVYPSGAHASVWQMNLCRRHLIEAVRRDSLEAVGV